MVSLKPRSRSTSRQVASCPVAASGVLMPISAIQSIIRCQSDQSHHAML